MKNTGYIATRLWSPSGSSLRAPAQSDHAATPIMGEGLLLPFHMSSFSRGDSEVLREIPCDSCTVDTRVQEREVQRPT